MFRKVIDRAAVLADWRIGNLRLRFADLLDVSSVDESFTRGDLIRKILRIEFATLLEPK